MTHEQRGKGPQGAGTTSLLGCGQPQPRLPVAGDSEDVGGTGLCEVGLSQTSAAWQLQSVAVAYYRPPGAGAADLPILSLTAAHPRRPVRRLRCRHRTLREGLLQ